MDPDDDSIERSRCINFIDGLPMTMTSTPILTVVQGMSLNIRIHHEVHSLLGNVCFRIFPIIQSAAIRVWINASGSKLVLFTKQWSMNGTTSTRTSTPFACALAAVSMASSNSISVAQTVKYIGHSPSKSPYSPEKVASAKSNVLIRSKSALKLPTATSANSRSPSPPPHTTSVAKFRRVEPPELLFFDKSVHGESIHTAQGSGTPVAFKRCNVSKTSPPPADPPAKNIRFGIICRSAMRYWWIA